MTVSVVIPATRPCGDLLGSLAMGTRVPDEMLVVSNEVTGGDLATTVKFWSEVHPIGRGDAGLRRNVGAAVASGDILLFLDDDLIAPVGLVEAAVDIAERDGFCWGHHRYIDFEPQPWTDLLQAEPEIGRPREHWVNDWHGWQSSYAGLLAIKAQLFWDVGGFDLAYLGHHGSEDQQFGRRLSLRGIHPNATFVHEPPFAWHPERNLFHSQIKSNIIDGHPLVRKTVNGFEFLACENGCPCRSPIDIDGITMSDQVVIPFNRDEFSITEG